MNFSTLYAESYDSIHAAKNYTSETLQIIELIKSIFGDKYIDVLDFGCGTGNHIGIIKSKGFEIDGFDISKSMLKIAKKKNSDIKFTDNFDELKANYAFVYSLFDVFSYQYTEELALDFLSKFIGKIRPGGLGLFDTWNLSGVKLDPPTERTRKFQIMNEGFERIVTPFPMDNEGLYQLKIHVNSLNNSSHRLIESHYLKAYSEEEITSLLNNFPKIDFSFRSAGNYAENLGKNDWRLAVVIQKKN
jgi:SAM-dependent methyltransferase